MGPQLHAIYDHISSERESVREKERAFIIMNTTTSRSTSTTSSSISGETQTLLGDSSSSDEGGGRVSPVVKKSSSDKMRAYGGAVGAVCATAMVALAVANGGSASSFTGGDVTAAGRGVLPRRMAMLGKGGSAASSS